MLNEKYYILLTFLDVDKHFGMYCVVSF